MRFSTLDAWLAWQAALHPTGMDLGLERCQQVLQSLEWGPLRFPVVTVGGTNGKGSTVAFTEAVYRAAGYRVGTYTSPHLIRYNERVRIDGAEVSDHALMTSFERIDVARGTVSITFFEYATLAAVDQFRCEEVDVALLEVGLGGGLDAVNLFDPDVAVITSIGIDHERWLGSDRHSIASHKAGIFRAGSPAVIGDRNPPAVLRARALALGAPYYALGEHFDWRCGDSGDEGHWDWWEMISGTEVDHLPRPTLAGEVQQDNAASALMAVQCLADRLPVPAHAKRAGVERAWLPGRFQRLGGRPEVILDVAHNGAAADRLADRLRAEPCSGRTRVVIAMFEDKDHMGMFAPLLELADAWYLASLEDARGGDATTLGRVLGRVLRRAGARGTVCEFERVSQAYGAALAASAPDDRVVVCGSFRTVAQILSGAETVASSDGPTSLDHRGTGR